MKTFRTALALMGALLLASTIQSCLDDDKNTILSTRYPNALVTVKTSSDNDLYLQLDDTTTLLPTNLTTSPFGEKEVRALLHFTETDEDSKGYSKAVYVNWIDSILTKPAVPALTTAENDSIYGTDPLEIVNDWVTIAEDGYLTLRFSTLWGGQKTHFINLLTGVNPDDPYEVELRHNANGDTANRKGDALVAFSLTDLPDTEGQTVKLTINWQSFSGKKSAEFNFCSRTTTETANMLHGETEFVTSLE